MTIAVAICTVDSVVLASDSTTTHQMMSQDGRPETANLWNSANKIFNLRKGWPLGAMTWGGAVIGDHNIATLAKELRCRLSGKRPDYADWELDPATYTVQQAADLARKFFYDEHYQKNPVGLTGIAVTGYSAAAPAAETFIIQMTDDGCPEPMAIPPGVPTILWEGQPEAINRLVFGVSASLPEALIRLGVPSDEAGSYAQAIGQMTQLPLTFAGMPIGEVIDLADFLVDATIKFVRFTPGHQTVGGPIEIAAITRHEGFKWIKRKHHYPAHLNTDGTLP